MERNMSVGRGMKPLEKVNIWIPISSSYQEYTHIGEDNAKGQGQIEIVAHVATTSSPRILNDSLFTHSARYKSTNWLQQRLGIIVGHSLNKRGSDNDADRGSRHFSAFWLCFSLIILSIVSLLHFSTLLIKYTRIDLFDNSPRPDRSPNSILTGRLNLAEICFFSPVPTRASMLHFECAKARTEYFRL